LSFDACELRLEESLLFGLRVFAIATSNNYGDYLLSTAGSLTSSWIRSLGDDEWDDIMDDDDQNSKSLAIDSDSYPLPKSLIGMERSSSAQSNDTTISTSSSFLPLAKKRKRKYKFEAESVKRSQHGKPQAGCQCAVEEDMALVASPATGEVSGTWHGIPITIELPCDATSPSGKYPYYTKVHLRPLDHLRGALVPGFFALNGVSEVGEYLPAGSYCILSWDDLDFQDRYVTVHLPTPTPTLKMLPFAYTSGTKTASECTVLNSSFICLVWLAPSISRSLRVMLSKWSQREYASVGFRLPQLIDARGWIVDFYLISRKSSK
jgi:hypothetical protein